MHIRYTRECISYLYHLDQVQIKIAVNPKGLFTKKFIYLAARIAMKVWL